MSAASLKPLHLFVLYALYRLEQNNHYLWTFEAIRSQLKYTKHDLDLDLAHVRRLVRFLKRKGLVNYSQAYSEEDYLVVGSGHRITPFGKEIINEQIKKGFFD